MPISQKKLYMLGGAGLVASGIVTILLISQELFSASEMNSPTINEDSRFQMEEVHASSNLVIHVHAHMALVENGEQVQLPEQIGISPDLWKDHSLDVYGPSAGLIAPLHTHDTSGTIHVESTVDREFTLDDFLRIWGISYNSISRVTDEDGGVIEDYSNHILQPNEQLVLEILD